jgi:hypothetical protein
VIKTFKLFEKRWYGLGELEEEDDYNPEPELVIAETITIDDDGFVPFRNGLSEGLKFKSSSNLTFDIWGGTTISITIGFFRDFQLNFARVSIENWKGTREELDILVDKATHRFNHSHTYTYHRNARELVEVNIEILHPEKLNEIFNILADNFVEYNRKK